ncbi:helix-turn-helix domain-containing protein [Halococcus sediminicola]|uniref:helix-turn-helix domain-containing protein n=1 Tax=Halococcus sediminicola TaxID=1264579 RepID=UPI000679172B|nr:helix-turn-helix domain-containing protein [Halococcus sediminicola]
MCDTGSDSASLADLHPDLSQLFPQPNKTSQEVVRAIFGLKQGEIRAYFALTDQPHSSTDQLADELDQHRRYVARSLRGLHEVNLAEREHQTLENGGRGYVYEPAPVEEMKQYLDDQLTEWTTHLRAEIETLETEIEAELAADGGANENSCSQSGDE